MGRPDRGGATEVCDEFDNHDDLVTDGSDPGSTKTWYADSYGDPSNVLSFVIRPLPDALIDGTPVRQNAPRVLCVEQ